ncbi:MAG TPA: hypothetical protein VMM16_13060 [Verrucomicrobiae bacterium]|nr:hypothetical protein [Verrucomicrobiae bacterium]
MRAKIIFALVAGMLFCTLSMIEFPEFMRLTDDTSNDYSLIVVQEAAPTASQAQTPRSSSGSVARTASAPRPAPRVVRMQSRGSAPSVDDFLHSLCTLRT